MSAALPAGRPRGRKMLVYASPRVLEQAREVVGDGVVVEQLVAAAVQAGLRRTMDGVDVELRPDERLARPLLDGERAPWVAVVARSRGRLVRRRPRSCWQIRRLVRLSEEPSL